MSIVNPTNELEEKVNRDIFHNQRLAEEKQIWMQAYCASLVGVYKRPPCEMAAIAVDIFKERFYPEDSK